MKNSNIEQNRKFGKQVSHLQSFIGVPMSSGHNPSLSEVRENDRRLLEKQALGFEPERKNILSRVFTGLISIKIKAFKQVTKSGAKIAEEKGFVKIGPECC